MTSKSRILLAGESLFAEHGFYGVTIRAVARAAKVNLAAVNYHFYDLESLCRDILVERLRTINALRLERLARAEKQTQPAPVPLRTLFEILGQPLIVSSDCDAGYNSHSRRLLGRLLLEPFPSREAVLADEFEPAMARFAQALRRHVPGMPPTEFMWRFSMLVGALHHTLATMHEMRALTGGLCCDGDADSALEAFVALAVSAWSS